MLSCLPRCTGGDRVVSRDVLAGTELSPEMYWRGPRSQEVGDAEAYLKLRLCHQNEFCIRMGSSESHFNVSLIVRGKVTRLCS